jgi:hypothetical protein
MFFFVISGARRFKGRKYYLKHMIAHKENGEVPMESSEEEYSDDDEEEQTEVDELMVEDQTMEVKIQTVVD